MLQFSEAELKQKIGTLSGGQRARVAIASCLLSGASVIVLDEPTNHLDLASAQVMERALIHFPGAVVVVSHDRFFIDKVADRLLTFDGAGGGPGERRDRRSLTSSAHRGQTGDMSDWNQNIIDEFRANGGTVQTAGFGRGLVLLHHLGAKTGEERVSPVAAIRTDDAWLIAASKGGADTNPAWFHNLLAHPDASIETPDDGTVDVHVEQLTGAARDEAWGRFKERSSGFASYEAKTTRVIPVLELRRRSGSGGAGLGGRLEPARGSVLREPASSGRSGRRVIGTVTARTVSNQAE